jgi:hypothetical protein
MKVNEIIAFNVPEAEVLYVEISQRRAYCNYSGQYKESSG